MMSKDVEKGIVDIKRRVPETGDSATTEFVRGRNTIRLRRVSGLRDSDGPYIF